MSLLSKLSNLFKKRIKLDEKRFEEFVVPQKLRYGKLKMDTKVSVPENFVMCLALSGVAYDFFPAGTHTISALTIPKCVKKFKLDKRDKDGKYPNAFKIDCYYISLNELSFEWNSYRRMQFLDPDSGFFKASVKGIVRVKASDAQKLLQNLLLVYSYLKRNEPKQIIDSWVSEIVTEKIEKKNYPLKILLEKTQVQSEIGEILTKKFSTYGLEVLDFSITEVNIPKKYTNSIEANDNIKKEEEMEKINNNNFSLSQKKTEESENFALFGDSIEEASQPQASDVLFGPSPFTQQEAEQKEKVEKQTLFAPNTSEQKVPQHTDAVTTLFGETSSIYQSSYLDQESRKSLFGEYFSEESQSSSSSSVFTNWQTEQNDLEQKDNLQETQQNEKKFIDLNGNSLYHKDSSVKKICPYCGEVNSTESDFCINAKCRKYMGN